MKKSAAIELIISAHPDDPIIFTTGHTSRIAYGVADRPNHFYMVGSMGLAASIAIGVAAKSRRTTLVVDGDGSLLMNPVNLLVAGEMPGLPLLHFVLNDGLYNSTGGQSTPSSATRISALAKAAGYTEVVDADDEDSLTARFSRPGRPRHPAFVHCSVDPDARGAPPRIDLDLLEIADRFSEFLRYDSRQPLDIEGTGQFFN